MSNKKFNYTFSPGDILILEKKKCNFKISLYIINKCSYSKLKKSVSKTLWA